MAALEYWERVNGRSFSANAQMVDNLEVSLVMVAEDAPTVIEVLTKDNGRRVWAAVLKLQSVSEKETV